MVLAVEDEDIDGKVRQSNGSLHPTKTRSYDNNLPTSAHDQGLTL